jgi:hypothetical protein
MNIQNKIIYIFNKFLINFLKEIKKENYFKVAIKKNYKVIDKNSDKYIKSYVKKTLDFNELLCKTNLELSDLLNNEEFTNLNILKNINVGRLFKVFKTEEDSNTVISYILTLQLLSIFYSESIKINEKLMKFVNGSEKILDDDEDVEDVEDDEDEDEKNEDDDDDDEDEKNEDEDDEDDDEDDNEDEDEDEDEDEEQQLDDLLLKSLNIINNNSDSELSEILDDDIRNLLQNIKNIKINIVEDENNNNGNIDDLIGDSKIGQLAKEISNQIDVDSLNLDINNPSELLNPANLFGGENGNILGDLVQQVGSSITEKMNSGELKQEDLVKDAFSLMNKMQNNSSGNPILDNMMGNMMGNKNENETENKDMDINNIMKNMMGNQEGGMDINNMMKNMMGNQEGGMDINNMMKNMMGNQDMMQQMMNNMGGTQAVNQNNPNSREGKAKERLRKKLAEKNKS